AAVDNIVAPHPLGNAQTNRSPTQRAGRLALRQIIKLQLTFAVRTQKGNSHSVRLSHAMDAASPQKDHIQSCRSSRTLLGCRNESGGPTGLSCCRARGRADDRRDWMWLAGIARHWEG